MQEFLSLPHPLPPHCPFFRLAQNSYFSLCCLGDSRCRRFTASLSSLCARTSYPVSSLVFVNTNAEGPPDTDKGGCSPCGVLHLLLPCRWLCLPRGAAVTLQVASVTSGGACTSGGQYAFVAITFGASGRRQAFFLFFICVCHFFVVPLQP